MINKLKWILFFMIFFEALFAQEKREVLSLEECITMAIKNNLDVAVEVLNPEMADISVIRAGEKFMPALSLNYSNQENNSASYSFMDAADVVKSNYFDYTLALEQLIPTGGRFSVSLNSYKNNTNRSFQTINPRFGSTLTFNFTQPLLRNFGFKVNRREILIARNNMEISENQFRNALLETIYKVEEAYWNLVYSIENLKVKRQSLELARDLLAENQKKVEVGTLAPIEIYTAQAEVATREADILEAEAQVKNSEDLLKTILNLFASEGENLREIVPKDKPVYQEREVRLEEAFLTALENRPDLKAMKLELKNKELDLSYAKNQLLPELDLQASYWSPGITGDRILYLNDNPLTRIVVGIIPGEPRDALKDAFKFKFDNWSLKLTLNIPLNTVLTRAEQARAKVSFKQALLKLKSLEQKIYLEIKTAVRAVQTNYKKVQAYRAARELAEKKLEAEEEKFKVGLSTNYFLLQYQRDVANARSAELKAIIDYNLSLANLDKVLGTTFASKNIKLYEIKK